MELRQLEYFLAVAGERSFTLAAKRLHVVQSAVSAGIRALERDLGAPLFERSAQRVELTEIGAALLPRARATLDAAQAARDVVEEHAGGVRGTVRLGMLPGVDLVDFPALAADFRRRYPRVDLALRVAGSGSAGIEAALVSGELDVAVLGVSGAGSGPHGALSTRELARLPQVLLVHRAHPLADAGSVQVAQLRDESFVDFPLGYATRTVADRVFAAAGIERQIAVEVGDIGVAPAYVGAGLGVAIIPAFAAPADERVRVLRIDGDDLTWSLHVATSRTRTLSAAASAVLALVGSYVLDRPGVVIP
jgi:DNA-binding transcriptional LysR family regulator